MRGEAASRAGSLTAATLLLARDREAGGTGRRTTPSLSAKAIAAECHGAVRVSNSNINGWQIVGTVGLFPPAVVCPSAKAVTVAAP